MSMHTEWVDLSVDDGTTMRAYVARPEGEAPQRGLIVCQEAFGLNAHIRDVAGRFAAAGFIAIAPELYHRTAPGFDVPYNDLPTAMTQLKQITVEGLEADIRASMTRLDRAGVAGNTASVGYCMGGRVSFVANTSVPLKAGVSYYGGGLPPLAGRAPSLSGPMLFFWGGLDHHIPDEHRRAIVSAVGAAGKPFVDVLFSNADHGFFCDARPSYHPSSATQAWSLTLAFLDTYCPR